MLNSPEQMKENLKALPDILSEHAKWMDRAVCKVSSCDDCGTHLLLAAGTEEDCVWFCERHYIMSLGVV